MRKTSPSEPPGAKNHGRKVRLAKALRENLKRRKAQLREREETRHETDKILADDESEQR
jgi:hypothetical protein